MIQFQSVTKQYTPEIIAVWDISFKISAGEFVFLIGPSGSGKTTIIKMLIRDETPTSGKIYFDDYDVTRISRSKVYKIRREVGVIFQDFKLIQDKTAYENVAFAMEAAGKKNKEIKERVPYLLDIVGLADRMRAFPKELSGGEQQRVAIARAISNNPRILIADEPTGNLDPASAWDIVQVLNKINNWGTTVMMSTHGTDIVNSMNKRVIQMQGGKIIRDDREGKYEMKPNTLEQLELGQKADKSSGGDKKKSKTTFKVSLSSKPQEQEEASKKKSKRPRFFIFGKKRKPEEKEAGEETKKEVKEKSTLEKKEEKEDVKDQKKTTSSEGEAKPFEAKKPEEAKSKKPTQIQKKKKSKSDSVDKEKKAETQSLHLEMSASTGLAREIKKEETKEPEKKVEVETDRDVSDLPITQLDLPKELIKDLKKAGFKTVQDVVDEGPEGLSEKLTIDPEEVILVATAIGKILKG